MVSVRIPAWDLARAEIAKVRPNLAEHLDDCYKSQPPEVRASLEVMVAEYRYGARIIDDGRPYLPGEQQLPPQFITSERLPLGIITENSCESTEYAASDHSNIPVAETILAPGDFIGLFEAVDVLTRVPRPPLPKWNIYAGVCSIYALPNLATQQNQNKLERALTQHIDGISLERAGSLLNQLKLLKVFTDISNEWKVRIIYFSRGWLDIVGDSRAYSGKVTENLVRRAWKNLARIRDKDAAALQKKLREAVGSDRAETADAAGLLLKRVSDVLARRQPCYVPVKLNSIYGPFGEIAERVLGHITPENWILCPTYLPDEPSVGYLKLDQVVPAVFGSRSGGSVKDRVFEMFSVLRSAVQQENRAKHPNQEIISYMDLLKRIMFQTPPSAKSARNSKPSVYRIDFGGKLAAVTPDELTQSDFYSPLFATLPSERCAFFRHTIRLDAGIP